MNRTSTATHRVNRRLSMAAVGALVVSCLVLAMPSLASAAVVQSLSASVTASGSVTVTWDQPSGAGSNDYSYTVYFRAGASGGYTTRQVAAGTESTVLTDLTGGQSYEIRVTSTPVGGARAGDEGCNTNSAVDAVCNTLSEAASTSVTAATTPAAPTITDVTEGNGQIAVTFSAGAANGATVGQYTVTCGSVSNTGTSSPITVTSLTNGVATTCTVTAGSNVGDSAASAASESVTPSTTPDQMAAPGATAGNGNVTVTWSEVIATDGSAVQDGVVDDGGSAVTGYEISITNADTNAEVTTATAGADESSDTISGLTNGTSYKARVRATNANGSGAYSDYSASFTPTGSDVAAPSVSSFTSSQSTPTNSSSFTYTIEFSETVTGVAAGDFTNTGSASGCTFDPGTDTGTSRTVTVSGCASGTVIPRFAANGATDSATNTGPTLASTATSTITVDRTAPSVSSFTSAQSTPTGAASFTYTLTFSENVTGVAAGDFTNSGTATGCTFAPGADSGSSRTVTVSGCSAGTVTPVFAINGAADAVSNTGPASAATATTTITRDASAPSVSSFTSAQSSPTAASSFTYTLTFSENVTGVAAGDFSNTGTATGCTFAPGADSGSSRTVTVSGCSNGTVTPQFAADGASDGAGNTGPASAATATTTITRESADTVKFPGSEAVILQAVEVNRGGITPSTEGKSALTVTIRARNGGFSGTDYLAVSIALLDGGAGMILGHGTGPLSLTGDTYQDYDATVPSGWLEESGWANIRTVLITVVGSNSPASEVPGNRGPVVESISLRLDDTEIMSNPEFLDGNADWFSTLGWQTCSAVSGTRPCATVDTSDVTGPSVSSFTSSQSTPTNATTIAYTLAFSEFADGVASGDFTNTGTAEDCEFYPVDPSGTSITVNVMNCGEGTVIPQFAAGSAYDSLGNSGPSSTATATTTVTIDRTAPTIASFTSAQSTPTNSSSFTYSLTFSETVTGVAAGDFSNTGTASDCSFAVSGSGSSYTVTVSGCGTGTVTPEFFGFSAVDAADNSGPDEDVEASNTITVDRTKPGVSVFTSDQSTPTNSSSFTYGLGFDESVTGVASDDFTNAGTASGCSFSVSGSTDEWTITVSGCGSGTVIPRFAANGATDSVSNTGPASAATATTTITVDRTAPSVSSFTSAQSSPTNAASFTYTLTFSESVTGVAAGDFSNTGTATGCSFAPGSDSGSSRTVTVSGCSEGTVIPRFAADGATDAVSNTGPSSAATATTTITRDTTAPSVSSFTSAQSTPTNAASFSFTLVFSESVTGVLAGDFTNTGTATGCAFAPGSDSGTTRTVLVSGCSEGTVIPRFAADAATDAATNTGPSSAATATTTIVRDTTVPTATWTVPSSPSSSRTLSYTLTFSESVSGIVADDFINAGTAADCAFTPSASSGASVTVSVTCSTDGTVLATLVENSVSDAAGNDGPVADVEAASVLITPPPPPPTTTTTTTAPSPSVPSAPTTTVPPTTVPNISVPPRLGTEVQNLPDPPARVAEDTAIATRPGVLTVLIDPPNVPATRAIDRYIVTITPLRGGAPTTQTVFVTDDDRIIRVRFTGLRGRYEVTFTAIDVRGRRRGTWSSGTILVS
jgi:hypothetical protein